MPADDDEASGPPPHPLDRVWFHPSELGGSVTALRPQPAPSRAWVAAALALAIGVSGTLGVMAAIGGFNTRATDAGRFPRTVNVPVVDPDAVATLVTTVGRSVVTLTIDPGAGTDPVWAGSGVVVGPGRVLTAAHLLGAGGVPTVVTAGGEVGTAQVVGIDPETNLALLRIEGVELVPARLGSGDGLRIGQRVAAIAAVPGTRPWVSAGVLSGTNRMSALPSGIRGSGLLETDARFDPTAAGGALLDSSGAVIGILAGPERYVVPIDVARDVAAQLTANGAAVHGWLGVLGTDALDRPGGGVRVKALVPGSPAEAALQVDDVVVSVGSTQIGNVGDLVAAFRRLKPGDPVEIGVIRATKRVRVPATLESSVPASADWLPVA